MHSSAYFWVPLLVPGFDSEATLLTIDLVQIQLLTLPVLAGNSVLWSVEHSKNKFAWVELSNVISASVVFAKLYLSLDSHGVYIAAYALMLKPLMQMLLIVKTLGPPMRLDLSQESVKLAWQRIKPLLVATSYAKSDRIIDRVLTSIAAPGTLTLLQLSQQLVSAAHTVFDKAICTPMVPLLAKQAQNNEWIEFKNNYKKRITLMLSVMIGGYFVFLAIGEQVLGYIFSYGLFNNDNLDLLWMLIAFNIGFAILPPVGHLMSSVFYSVGETHIPSKIGVISYTIGLILKVVLFFQWGVKGLVFGISLHYIVGVSMLAFYLRRMKFEEHA